MGEEGWDLLEVMRDEHDRRRLAHRAHAREVLEEPLARDRIQALAWLIEDEKPRRRHQGPRDEDALTLALRMHAESAAPQMRRRERLERRKRAGLLDAREGSILADRGFQAGKHDRSGIVCVGEARLEGGGDEADLLAQLAQIGAA